MAKLALKIQAEIENITLVLSELRKFANKTPKSVLEIAGTGTFLHNFYTGIENIIKQILSDQQIPIPTSATWHKDLLDLAQTQKIISMKTREQLGKFLVFRHFFVHAYGFMLEEKELEPLIALAPGIFTQFKQEIQKYSGGGIK